MAFEKIPCRSNYISIHHFSKIQRVLFDAAGTYKSELGGEEKKTFFFLKKAVKSRKEKKGSWKREREKREGQVGIAVGSQISKSFSKDPFSLRDSLRCRREEKESERDREKSDKM